MNRYSIGKHTRTEHKEGRDGKIRARQVTTWDLVVEGELIGEYRTKTEAHEAAANLWEKCRFQV